MKKYKASIFVKAAKHIIIGVGTCFSLDKFTGDDEPRYRCERITRSEKLFAKMHKPRGLRQGDYWFPLDEKGFLLRKQLLREAALCLREQGFSED